MLVSHLKEKRIKESNRQTQHWEKTSEPVNGVFTKLENSKAGNSGIDVKNAGFSDSHMKETEDQLHVQRDN